MAIDKRDHVFADMCEDKRKTLMHEAAQWTKVNDPKISDQRLSDYLGGWSHGWAACLRMLREEGKVPR